MRLPEPDEDIARDLANRDCCDWCRPNPRHHPFCRVDGRRESELVLMVLRSDDDVLRIHEAPWGLGVETDVVGKYEDPRIIFQGDRPKALSDERVELRERVF
jgi:hypothetical protein